jgi:uncharacterized membrane-anchored protein YjiN (DUF445 family)
MTGSNRRAAALPDLDPVSRVKLRQLRRIKVLAGSVLLGTIVLLVLARFGERRIPALGFLAAFAEAATVGGLADWYAVVALFRRPLGLPIPHTAIIPQNQERIAESLGTFIEVHFLVPAPVRAKLEKIDFAGYISDWLVDEKDSADFAHFILKLLPNALDSAEGSGLRTFLAQRIMGQLESVEAAPFVAGVLKALTQDRRHQAIFDELLAALHKLMESPDTIAALRGRIRAELPMLLNLYRADALVLKKVVSSTYSLLEDVRQDPEHPLRHGFDRLIASLIDNLETSADLVARVDALKAELLARPELSGLAWGMWQTFRRFLEESAGNPDSALNAHLGSLLVNAGRELARDSRLKADINHGMVLMLLSFIESQKTGVSQFVAEQVKSWDIDQLVRLIEINIGRDLQYIRFNGTLIGGLAGLALHTAQVLLL